MSLFNKLIREKYPEYIQERDIVRPGNIIRLYDNLTEVFIVDTLGVFENTAIVINKGFFFKNKNERVVIDSRKHIVTRPNYLELGRYLKPLWTVYFKENDLIKLPDSEFYGRIVEYDYTAQKYLIEVFTDKQELDINKNDKYYKYYKNIIYLTA